MKKTILILALVLFSLNGALCGNRELAASLIKKAAININISKDLSSGFLAESYEYDKTIPEYYYYMLILSGMRNDYTRNTGYAAGIIKNVDNSFYQDNYTLLKKAAESLVRVRAFAAAGECYERMSMLKGANYLECVLGHLYMLENSGDYRKMLEVASGNLKKYTHDDLYYYKLLAEIKLGSSSSQENLNGLNALKSFDYDKSRVLYIESMLDADRLSVDASVKAFSENTGLSKRYTKRILYNLIFKADEQSAAAAAAAADSSSDATTDIYSQTAALLELWQKNGGAEDLRTLAIAGLPGVNMLRNSGGTGLEWLVPKDVIMTADSDEDGNPESAVQYRAGVPVKKYIDADQDRVFEKVFDYYANGLIKTVKKRSTDNGYFEMEFNKYDSTLIKITHFANEILNKIDYYYKTTIPYKDGVEDAVDSLSGSLDYSEIHDKYVSIVKRYKGVIQYEDIDRDNNGVFEYKRVYDNNLVNDGYIDINGDGQFDVFEIYDKGVLKRVNIKNDPYYGGYDYYEEYGAGNVSKFWDNNRDGVFEVNEISAGDKSYKSKFDINYDGRFDFMVTGNGNAVEFYKLSGSSATFLSRKLNGTYNVKYGYTVVSIRDYKTLPVPESIVFKTDSTGVFIAAGVKNHFSDNLIKIGGVSYRLYAQKGEIYLFDMYGTN